MYTKWTAHCKTDQEKIQFESDVRRARPVLERLIDILKQDEEIIDREETNVKNFSYASWPYLQAYWLGGKAAIKQLIKIIDLDKQKDTTNE